MPAPAPALTRREALAAAAMAAAAATLAGCATTDDATTDDATASDEAATSTAATSQVIVAMGTSNEPSYGFDPVYGWGAGEHVHDPLVQSTLVRTDANMEFECDLATSYACSDDGLTWTFELRDDAFFTDGEQLTAADVAFTVNQIRATAASETDLSVVEEAVATGELTVELRLSKPCCALLYTLAVVGIVPEHAWGEGYGAAPVGSGPYVLEQWDVGQQAIFAANPDYYGAQGSIERVVVVFMEEDAALAAARAGEVDLAYTSATYAEQEVEGYELTSIATVDSRGVSLPVVASGATREQGGTTYDAGNDVTCHQEVRQAVSLAADREAMVDYVLGGHGEPAYSVGDGMPWASDDMQVEHDAQAACALLEGAGWTLGADGVYELDGTRCALELYYPSSDSVRQALANELANELAEVGIELTLHGESWDVIYEHQFSDLVLWGWGSNSPMDVYELSHSDGTMNYSSFESDVTDAYLDRALACTTVEDSYELWQASEWDGSYGIAPQGEATWAWLVNVDHLYWRREGLDIGEQRLQPHGHGWSVLSNLNEWAWS